MSMLKKLKRIFIVEDETLLQAEGKNKGGATQKSAPKSSPKKKPAAAKKSDTTTPPSTSGKAKPSGNTKPAPKFVNLLLGAIEQNNVEGFDYLEFKNSVRSLEKVEADESKRFQNAFAMAGAMGLTKSKLFSSAKHYVSVLDKEEKKFAEAVNGQRQKQINERDTKGKALEQSIKSKEAEIKKLRAEIEKEKKQLGSVESDVAKAMAKVEATKEGFYAAYHMVLNQIKDDLDKISSHIK